MSSHAYITNVGYDNVTLDKKGWDDYDSNDWHSHRQTNGNSYDTGCPVFTEIFQEALIGTYIPQYLMTNDSFSSQTWAISVPNRNSDVKSISWPTGPPRVRSQNKGYWQYSTI